MTACLCSLFQLFCCCEREIKEFGIGRREIQFSSEQFNILWRMKMPLIRETAATERLIFPAFKIIYP